ncbi:MAG: Nif3-like dinuclear metal center hexameric protein, partial [Victivallales bacterium]|nr:Nif3-like dinuclear metal center hexameric protein [Victivallales bacterium]
MSDRKTTQQLKDVVGFLDEYLKLDFFPGDPSNNGLQVEAGGRVSKIILAVDASMELIELAAKAGADLLVVHHGLSWGPGFQRLTGLTGARFAEMFKNGISLYASHLPLDAHPEVGHNVVIASKLGLSDTAKFAEYAGAEIGVMGTLPEAMTAVEFAKFAESSLGLELSAFGNENREIREAGVVSGGAGSDGVLAAAELGLDCLVTGEVKHESWHIIRESGILVLSGGHYATETFGLKSLSSVLEKRFSVEC